MGGRWSQSCPCRLRNRSVTRVSSVFFGFFSKLPSLDFKGSSTRLSHDLFSDMAFRICRATSGLLFSPSDIITMVPALGDSVLSIICVSIKVKPHLDLLNILRHHACRPPQARSLLSLNRERYARKYRTSQCFTVRQPCWRCKMWSARISVEVYRRILKKKTIEVLTS